MHSVEKNIYWVKVKHGMGITERRVVFDGDICGGAEGFVGN